eukprot:TRINITY_DN10859_c0_g1_i1.p1 TRINITY_DN10859_c0_g1~~TRINITY_DN10859_c0_g1_i1.p1  ORF type:complete len:273 (+),score=77.96 TRINITY_DN10859_c0_g1_i1:318-1136(+)
MDEETSEEEQLRLRREQWAIHQLLLQNRELARSFLSGHGFTFIEEDSHEPEQEQEQSPLSEDTRQPITLLPLQASTCDHPEQSIDAVLHNNMNFWSSTGADDRETNDHLLFGVEHFSIITQMIVHVYQCPYQLGHPIYPPSFFSFSMTNQRNEFDTKQHSGITKCIASTHGQSLHLFKKTDPLLEECGMGVQLNLYGRNQLQMEDNRFYTCLRFVEAKGVQVDLETLHRTLLVLKDGSRCDGVAFPLMFLRNGRGKERQWEERPEVEVNQWF